MDQRVYATEATECLADSIYKEMSDMNNLEGHDLNTSVRMSRWPFLLVVSLILCVPLLFLTVEPGSAHMFLNSAEPQCNGSDPTVLMCDDYEDGSWFVTNADSGGAGDPQNDGWRGTIYATDPLNQNFARCSGKGAVGTNCTATTANRSTSGKGGQAWHRLGPQTATNRNEIYHREYIQFLPGYKFGHEKWTFYEDGSVQHGLTQTPFSSDMFDWAMQQGRAGSSCDLRCPQNQGKDLHMIPGHWYYMETHLKLGTGNQDGLVEFWQDDCGANGLGCTGSGTLRLRHTGLSFSNASKGCCDAHQENWCPSPGGAGVCNGEVYRDQTVWATRRIGPMGNTGGDTIAPAMPAGVKLSP